MECEKSLLKVRAWSLIKVEITPELCGDYKPAACSLKLAALIRRGTT
jgi:hypothetical protein